MFAVGAGNGRGNVFFPTAVLFGAVIAFVRFSGFAGALFSIKAFANVATGAFDAARLRIVKTFIFAVGGEAGAFIFVIKEGSVAGVMADFADGIAGYVVGFFFFQLVAGFGGAGYFFIVGAGGGVAFFPAAI